jgi:hypothetical protein
MIWTSILIIIKKSGWRNDNMNKEIGTRFKSNTMLEIVTDSMMELKTFNDSFLK